MSNLETTKVTVVTPATAEPVTVAELQDQTRDYDETHYGYLASLISTAREQFESDTRLTLITATFDAHFNAFAPCNGALVLPRRPVQSVTSVTYIDTDGATQTLSSSTYYTDLKGTFTTITPVDGWPDTDDRPNAVTVRFVAGFGAAAAVPASYRHAIKAAAASHNENREAVITGTIVNVLPYSYGAIVNQARTVEV